MAPCSSASAIEILTPFATLVLFSSGDNISPAPCPPTLVIYFSQKIDARRDLARTLSLPFSFSLLLSGNSRYARVHASRIKILNCSFSNCFFEISYSIGYFSLREGNMWSKMNAHFESMILFQFLRSQK